MGATKGSVPLLLLRKSRDPVSAAQDVLSWIQRHGVAVGKEKSLLYEWRTRAADGYDILFIQMVEGKLKSRAIKVPDDVPHFRNGPPTLALGGSRNDELNATVWVKEFSGRSEDDPMNKMEVDSILLAYHAVCHGFGASGLLCERDANMKIVSSSFKSFGSSIVLGDGSYYPTEIDL